MEAKKFEPAKEMQIREEFPPNIEEIKAKFELSGGEIFAWDGDIYNPTGEELTPELIAHEKVHFQQHRLHGGTAKWWAKYLSNTTFRLRQELVAHRVEYRTFCKNHKDRNERARYLNGLALRLASPMYGSAITPMKARTAIRRYV